MNIYDNNSDPGVDMVVQMLQRLSGARTAQEAFVAFMERFWKLRPVKHFLGVVPDSSGPDRFRITFHVSADCIRDGAPLPSRNPTPDELDALPVYAGGLIAQLITRNAPTMIHDLDLRDDPAIADLSDSRTVMALPVFAGQHIAEWMLAFSAESSTITPRDFHHALLTSNFMGMTNSHLSSMEEIRRLNAAMTAQFEEVARIQQALLPERIPDIPGLSIATSYLTCDHAGGDYYDFFPLADGRWGILIADVSGHGAGAATVMAMLHAILHCHTQPDPSPATILTYANRKLLEARIEGNFVTAFLAIYDPERGLMHYSSSGHNPPRLKSGRDGAVRAIDDANALPLGILEPYEIESGMITLHPRDTIILYTDGITEAFNTNREMFGTDRLDAALAVCTGDPDCVIDSVHTSLYEHTRARTRADDQTLVAIRYWGNKHPREHAGKQAVMSALA